MQTSLPIWQIHGPIVQSLRDGNRLVLAAPTGSGKTTQVPQMLLDSGLCAGRIVILQPRRVAARTVAARVAWERHGPLGGEVGYQIRFEDRTSLGTRLCYVTEGILLRWLQDDSALADIGAVLFDEFHERNLLSDVALALVKRLQQTRRPDLRVVVMSATLQAEPVARYLGGCPILISEGKAFPVDIRHISLMDERPASEQAADAVAQITREGDPGDILIFMPGMGEINSTMAACRAAGCGEELALIPLHGDLPAEEQDRAFAPHRLRKVVVATNVAETSVTIDGIIHVIDSGLARVARYDAERGIGTLFIEPISRASAQQRAGRAGRTAPGVCHRLWTESQHLNMPERNTPEIQRSDLAEVVLLLHSFGIRDAARFDWLDQPDPQAVERAEQLLRILGALRPAAAEPGPDITPIGREMLRLPMHPRYSRMLAEAARHHCAPAAALCAALVSGRDLLARLSRDDKHIAEARELFEASAESDFFTLMRAWQFARNNGYNAERCRRYGVHAQIARQVQQTFEHVLQAARAPAADAPPQQEEALPRCIAAGFIDQLCKRRDQGTLDCDVADGREGVLARESVVQNAPLFVAASIREVSGRTGPRTLLGLATAVKREWIEEMFPEQVTTRIEHLFDPVHKRVSAVKLVRFHDLVIYHEHQREIDPAAAGRCLAEAAVKPFFELPLLTHDLKQTFARVNLVSAAMPELEFPPADKALITAFLARAFAGLTLAKEAQATPLRDLFPDFYGRERMEWLDELAPQTIAWPDGRKMKLLYPAEPRGEDGRPNAAELQVKLHECFALKEHPRVCEGKLPVKLWLCAPDGKRLDSTQNWISFKAKAYPKLKPALLKKFPGQLWLCLMLAWLALAPPARAAGALEEAWRNPPTESRLKAYWWWLNGNVTKESITRDLEQMKAKGFGGAVIVDANGASQEGNAPVPHGPTFFTPAWRELYKHTLREAHRLGLEISLNIQSGWNLGGPIVKPEDAAKKYVWSETIVTGGARVEQPLPEPGARENFYRDSFAAAYPAKARPPNFRPLENWKQKALQASLEPFSAPNSSPLFAEFPPVPGEEDTRTADVVDLTGKLGPDGVLRWDAPPGQWQVLRFGWTIGDHAYVSTHSDGWGGFALDVYDAGAFERYWNAIVEPLIADAGPPEGRALKYLHTDSWEIELANWTPGLREEFQKRRGYDLLPWLPTLAGRIVNNRDQSDRFLADYRKTLGDLAIDHHYRLFRDKAHAHGLLIHPEAGGPHAVPIDAQRCLGWDDAPMSEFWAWSWEHRIGDENRFFVKQPASAAHTYGRRLVLAEGFTDIGPHWQESIWSNLKPSFDKALCEGLNVLVWHAFVCSPEDTGIPGQQYFAGTHLNPKVTWWGQSQAFFSYIDRCQAMLQQGLPFADVLYYYGDHVPNFAQLKKSDPARVLPGYDYDVITEEALLDRASARDGQIVLPDGMSYRVLALPSWGSLSLPVLRKLKELVAAGATVIGPKPTEASGLQDYPQCDRDLKTLADELYGGKGIITNQTTRQVLEARGLGPDFAWSSESKDWTPAGIDYIHRAAAGADIYFVMNRDSNAVEMNCSFRVTGRAPELWDAVSGQHRFAAEYDEKEGRTEMALDLPPCGSVFAVFREPAAKHPRAPGRHRPEFTVESALPGPWTVGFDTNWGGPESVVFDKLESWTARAEPGVKYYSGTAKYRRAFTLPAARGRKLYLDLGQVRELAEVKVNGHDCGIAWTPPFRVDITDAAREGENALEIDVVNFWPNRIIGDQFLPASRRLTRTNIRKLTKYTALMPSGLLGPVQVISEVPNPATGSIH